MSHGRTSPDEVLRPCYVVVGAQDVATRRRQAPDAPIVALVAADAPGEAVLARAAGADVVLPTVGDQSADVPGLELAIETATALARRRGVVRASSTRTAHDLAEALNVVALAAEVGSNGVIAPGASLEHVRELARGAGADAWRAGHAHRTSARPLEVVDVAAAVHDTCRDAYDVEVVAPSEALSVLVDDHGLRQAISELVANARRAGAGRIRVEVTAAPGEVRIEVADDGAGLSVEQQGALGRPFAAASSSDRLGLGLATVSELLGDHGGSLTLAESHPEGAGHVWTTAVRMTLPRLEAGRAGAPRARVVDQASAQADILEGVVRRAPLAESLESIVAAIESQLPGSACSVLLLRDASTLHHGAGASLPAAYRAAIDGVRIGIGQGSCGTAAFLARPVVVSDVTVDPIWSGFRDVATEHGLRSCWSTPIVAAEDGEVLGTFAVYQRSVWTPDESAVRLVQRFTYLAAVAIEHHRLFGALAESESRFRSAFEGAAAGMALVRLDGTLLKVNSSLATLLDRPESALLSSNLLDLVHPDRRRSICAGWAVLAEHGSDSPTESAATEVPLLAGGRDDGPLVSLSSSLIEAQGERYFCVEVRDLTAMRKHLAEQRARQAAEAASVAKTDFLALVSHELRTPLNAILGFAQVMRLNDLDATQAAGSVEQIISAGQHLRDLIDDLLDLSRIDAGQLSVDITYVDTAEVVNEVLDLVRPLAAARGLVLGAAPVRGDTAVQVLADRRCLRQVLINLLGNAVKYTPAGGDVEIEVREVDGGRTRISVSDTGAGIPDDALDSLFQPFRRLSPETGGPEGTGLGLALAARLMDEMHGTIGVSSTVGVGSCFWVELPSAGPAAEALADAHAPRDEPPDAGEARGVVLYVEDDRASIAVLGATLSSRPHVELRTAGSVAEGLVRAAAGDVDLLLLDIGLPDASGWDLLREVRAHRPTLPAVVLTAGTDEVPADAPQHDQLLTKPLDLPKVLGAIDLVLGR